MAIQDIFEAVMSFKEAQIRPLVEAEIKAGTDVSIILREGLIAPLDDIGKNFSQGTMFLPEMMMAAQVVKGGLEVIQPLLSRKDLKPKATVVIGTVKGDLHDIGRNLVAMMLEGAGFRVIDLGVDVAPAQFLLSAQKYEAEIVALSALLTTTMPMMEKIANEFREKDSRAKIIIGGAPITQAFAEKIGATGYAKDAPGAVSLARGLTGN
jgi:5-methyltetrahydrofolate--homocysteine methyltransferase